MSAVLCLLLVCSELDKKFLRLSKARAPLVVEFDAFLTELVHGDPGRRDRSLAFYQLLVLTSLDVVHVAQDAEFGDVMIAKGPKWNVRLRSDIETATATASESESERSQPLTFDSSELTASSFCFCFSLACSSSQMFSDTQSQ